VGDAARAARLDAEIAASGWQASGGYTPARARAVEAIRTRTG